MPDPKMPDPNVLDPIDELRAVVAAAPPAPDDLAGYLAKVRERAYAVTDRDIETLQDRVADDVIFEQTVVAAIGEGLRRLDRSRDVIG